MSHKTTKTDVDVRIEMASRIPGCMGNYNFDNVAYYAKKRFIEGYSTIDLMVGAKTQREKEEIALVAMLDLDKETITGLKINCKYGDKCRVVNCQDLLRKLMDKNLKKTMAPVA